MHLSSLLPPWRKPRPCAFDGPGMRCPDTHLADVCHMLAGIHAQLLASTVLQRLPELSGAERDSITPLIRALDLHFPEAMDAAVNQLLQQGQGSDKAAAEQVVGLVQAALAGSAHAPLADAHSTLALALDAPSAQMRIMVSFCLSSVTSTLKVPVLFFHTLWAGDSGCYCDSLGTRRCILPTSRRSVHVPTWAHLMVEGLCSIPSTQKRPVHPALPTSII